MVCSVVVFLRNRDIWCLIQQMLMNFLKEGKKVKVPVLAVKACRSCRGIAQLILSLWERLRWFINSVPCVLYPRRPPPQCPLNRRLGEPHKHSVLWRRDKAFPAAGNFTTCCLAHTLCTVLYCTVPIVLSWLPHFMIKTVVQC